MNSGKENGFKKDFFRLELMRMLAVSQAGKFTSFFG